MGGNDGTTQVRDAGQLCGKCDPCLKRAAFERQRLNVAGFFAVLETKPAAKVYVVKRDGTFLVTAASFCSDLSCRCQKCIP
jgi:hypothetical protein